jgi:SAM-dependent methyltransferase
VIGVGEHLPFVDDCFDAVISVAVLEHVRDPFSCANELIRVLKPGGDLFCCIPFLQPLHGYPHHYFNASPQGHRSLFEDRLEVNDVFVVPATHPVASLTWILSSWSAGLSDEIRDEFLDMKVSELIRPTAELLPLPFAAALPKDKQLELASATVLTARKPRRPSSGGGKSLSGRSAR